MSKARLISTKKGIALESAIIFMTITFTFCFLLTSLVLYGRYQVKVEGIQMDIYVAREQVGEDFMAYLCANESASETFAAYMTDNNINYENYTCEEKKTQDLDITRYELTVLHKASENDTVVLYIQAEKAAQNQVTLITWQTSVPETT